MIFRTLRLLLSSILEFSFSPYNLKYWVIFYERSLAKLLICLRFFVLLSTLVVSFLDFKNVNRFRLSFLIYRLKIFLVRFFLINNKLGLYTRFEFSLIPIFLIVIGWGYQRERLKASLSMIFYTLGASLPLLAALVYTHILRFNPGVINMGLNWGYTNELLAFSFLLAFLVKTPLFLVHLWLPKAHVEAPVYGSILLAALLLKLGTWGFYLFSPWVLKRFITILIFSIALLRAGVVSLACLRIFDIKLIIAYSSVTHMALVIFLLCIPNFRRIEAGVGIMLAHGFSSAGLFYIAFIYYERTHSRALLLNKNILGVIPSLSLFTFLILILNIAAPPSFNLLVELLSIINIVNQFKWLSLILLLYVLATTGYSLIIYSSLNQTQENLKITTLPLTVIEMFNIFLYLIPGFFLILCVDAFI